MTVRRARATDRAEVLGIVRSIPELPQWTDAELAAAEGPVPKTAGHAAGEALLRVLLVAEIERRVVGFAQVASVAGEAELEGMGVLRDVRRCGVGRCLLEASVRWAEQAGAVLLRLEVRRGNSAAQAMYAAAGLEPVGTRRDYYRQPVEDAVLMQRNL